MSQATPLQTTQHGDVTVVHLDGEIVRHPEIFAFTDALKELVDVQKPTKLVINFEQVKRFSSEAINGLLTAAKKMSAYGGAIRLCGMHPVLHETIVVTNLDSTLKISPNVSAAVEAFRQQRI